MLTLEDPKASRLLNTGFILTHIMMQMEENISARWNPFFLQLLEGR